MDIESIMLSQKSQTEKDKNHIMSHIWGVKQKATSEQTKETNKFIDIDKHRKFASGEEEWGGDKDKRGQIYVDKRRLDYRW